ncbi:Glutamate receptor [Zostera marina]|uniref:Glutamate receptor n=1 Tax=Zostera marina TaxID=29655 RepID=A0A0K9NJM9_ZOSMR|nr:Glutamate receptor [Zostera marina]
MRRLSFFLFYTLASYCFFLVASPVTGDKRDVDIGVVLDMGSIMGKTIKQYLDIGIADFYKVHPNLNTRVVLRVKDSGNDSVGAASAALYLMKNLEVQAILGPQKPSQASFVIDLGTKAHVPIVSFTVNTPNFSPTKTPYFIRTGSNDKFQVDALAAIVENFGWKSVSLIAEDTEYKTGLIPYLDDAFQSVDARIGSRSMISPSADGIEITNELYKLKTMQTRVFVVHMLPPLSYRFFKKVRSVGMMTEGYVWIITEALSDLLTTTIEYPSNSKNFIGVLGVKTHVNTSEDIRFNKKGKYQLNDVDGLRAYDTAQAIAAAVETVRGGNLNQFDHRLNSSNTDPFSTLGLSKNGPRLREAILATKFESMAAGGTFHLKDGELPPPTRFEIINLLPDGWKKLGFWDKEDGLKLNASHDIIWPGDSKKQPKGWQIPTDGKFLRVGIPVKGGFFEFVDATNPQHMTGYCIDIFEAAIKSLPYSVQYEYTADNSSQTPGSYDDLVEQVKKKRFDAAVGDVTIIAKRSKTIDFTLPFTESGVSMLVPVKKDGGIANGWIFLKPLSKGLWLGTLAFFFLTGFTVWFIEHRMNTDFRGNRVQQMGTIFYFAFSTMVFAHKENVVSNFSKFVIIIWMFVVLILTSSYTASLTSMLTVEQLKPTLTDVRELVKNNDSVGYQDGSFVRELLIDQLKFKKTQLRAYKTSDEYFQALTNGSRNGGVSAIFDEIPYIRMFLKDRCKEFTMVGKTYKTDGFGFMFPKHSPLVSDISNAVLNVTQGEEMKRIERKWFGENSWCPVESSSIYDSNKLQFESFWGLFLITGLVSLLSMISFFSKFLYVNSEHLKTSIAAEKSLWGKVSTSMKRFDDKEEEEEEGSSRQMFMNHQMLQNMSAVDTSRDDTPQSATPSGYASHSPPPITSERFFHSSIELIRFK